MSEYQRYEFMTSDRPLSATQAAEVRNLSSHIRVSTGRALVDYNWGNFKHDPLDVLYRYFDGFLYWANWGAHRLGLRFPHGALPPGLLDGYSLDSVVTLTSQSDYDLLDIHFDELEGPDVWVHYRLGPLMPLREELMEGDRRALYVIWLAERRWFGGGRLHGRAANPGNTVGAGADPPIPPGLKASTSAQKALARLLRLPSMFITAAAQHSPARTPAPAEDFAAWLDLLPSDRQRDYLLRLTRDEPGLSRQFIHELRAAQPGARSDEHPIGPRLTFPQLHVEAQAIKARMEADRQERERQARLRRLREIHTDPDDSWRRVTAAVERGSGAGYNEAVIGLVELREVAREFGEVPPFEERFRSWVPPHLRRRAFVRRLVDEGFTLPEA